MGEDGIDDGVTSNEFRLDEGTRGLGESLVFCRRSLWGDMGAGVCCK